MTYRAAALEKAKAAAAAAAALEKAKAAAAAGGYNVYRCALRFCW
jgi:hypothetical protein